MMPRTIHRQRFYVLSALLVGAMAHWSCGKREATPHQPSPETAAQQAPAGPRFPKPERVKGLYLTAWSAGLNRKLDKILAQMKRNGLNSIVIDVRDDGHVYFKTKIQLAAMAGATTVAVVHPDKLMAKLEKNGVYPIARIACFRDRYVPLKRPDRAVVLADGRVWKDRKGYTWLDPYNQKNWEYLGEIVDFALELGFPEIQLDYVRFPSEGKKSAMLFPSKKLFHDPKAKPTQVIAEFARFIGDRVRAKGATVSADIFGIVSSNRSDEGIGQELETIAAPFDLLCPMVYPSHYAKGEYGIKNPNNAPYLIVLKSLKDYALRLPGKRIRPWLQDFSLGLKYGAPQVNAQIKAAKELGFTEFLLWNAQNRYSELNQGAPKQR